MSIKVVLNTKQVKEALEKNIEAALFAIGSLVETDAKLRTPVDTGALRANMGFDTDIKNKRVRIGNTLEYAIYVEKGTGIYAEDGNGRKTPWAYMNRKGDFVRTQGQKPQPFLTPAGEENIDKIVQIVAKYLRSL